MTWVNEKELLNLWAVAKNLADFDFNAASDEEKVSSVYMVPERFQPKQTKAKNSKGEWGVGSMFAQANMSVLY